MNRLGSLLCALGLALASSALARDTAIYDKAASLAGREKVFDAGSGFLQAFERLSLGPMLQQIPAHGHGLLMASWTPSTNPSNSPTFVIQHGGGGIGSMHIKMAQGIRREFGANVLILDSHWSRGRKSNIGSDFRKYWRMISATDRTYDLLAAGQWLAEKGVDPKRVYAVGESQGGMVVMRAFTAGTVFSEEIKKYFAKGIVLWPACVWWDSDHTTAHPLGAYHSPVIVFTGGRDYGSPVSECSAIKHAARHVHWEEATHAWMLATHGPYKPSEDGNCDAKTELENRSIDMCYSAARTQETWSVVKEFIQ